MSRSDPSAHACRSCGCSPCINPSFCRLCRNADRDVARTRPDLRTEYLCRLTGAISFERAWHELNDHRPAPQATIEAIMYCVRTRGIGALKDPANLARLQRCDQAAREQIDQRIAKLVAEGRVRDE
jgi:hypothetical protein